jgi:hypothetical protein
LKIEEKVAEQRKDELMKRATVLNVRGDRTKIKDGRDTGITTVTVIVTEKIPENLLAIEEVIPKTLSDKDSGSLVLTDVVVLKPTTWTAGKTTPSQKSIKDQKKLASGLKLDG